MGTWAEAVAEVAIVAEAAIAAEASPADDAAKVVQAVGQQY